jgi:NADPH:quinone reductase-like Zn-dependent oxidoreductase
MRAVVHERYGGPDVLRLAEVERPVPRDDEVLVRVHATTVNRTDCGFRQPRPFFVRAFSGLRRPRRAILGTEFAGVVDAVGADVTEFAPGDRVFGVNADRFGAHAEFLCVRERAPIATMPAGMGFEEAAAVCDGFILALTCLRWARLERGQRILIHGASGSIGTAAVQLANHMGADVTAVCDTKGVEIVGSLGADRVIDYTREDFTAIGETFDVVFDAVGKTSFRRCRRLVSKGGVFVETDLGFLWQNPLLSLLTWRLAPKRVLMPLPRYRKQEVRFAKELLEAGRYRAVIERRYPLEDVAEATRYVETERKIGNVVLTLSPSGDGLRA